MEEEKKQQIKQKIEEKFRNQKIEYSFVCSKSSYHTIIFQYHTNISIELTRFEIREKFGFPLVYDFDEENHLLTIEISSYQKDYCYPVNYLGTDLKKTGFLVGVNLDNQEIFFPFDYRNWLIYGTHGSGKSSFVKNYLFQLKQTFRSKEVQFLLFDSHKAYLEFQYSPYLYHSRSDNPTTMLDALTKLEEEFDLRMSFVASNTHPIFSKIVVVLDDYEALMHSKEEEVINMLLKKMVPQYDESGISFVFVSHNSGNGNRKKWMEQHSFTFVFKLPSMYDAMDLIGSKDPVDYLIPGDACYLNQWKERIRISIPKLDSKLLLVE